MSKLGKLFLIVLAFMCCPKYGVSQQSLADSLLLRLKVEKNSQVQADIYCELAFQLFDRDDSLATSYAKRALVISDSIHYQEGQKYANLLIGVGYFGEGSFRSAIRQFESSLAISVPGTEKLNVYALSLMGECYTHAGEYDSAAVAFKKGMVIGKKPGGEFWLPRTYCGLARLSIIKWENELALVYLDSAGQLLSSSEPDFRSLEWLTLTGRAYDNLFQSDSAMQAYQHMCELAEKRGDKYHRIKCAINNADFHYDKAEYTTALSYALQAIELSKHYRFLPQQVLLFLKIGEIYVALSEYELALSYFFKAVAIGEDLGLPYETADLYAEIAWVYKDQGRLDLALEFAEKSMDIRKKIGDRKGIANVHNIRGLVYLLQKRYDKSMEEHDNALKIRREINFQHGIVASLFNEALVYEQLGQYSRALELHLEVVEMGADMQNDLGLAVSFNAIGAILIKLNRFSEAQRYLQKAGFLIEKTGSKLARKVNYEHLSDLYEAQNDLQQALRYRKLYEGLKDSIFSEVSTLKMAELQALYEFERKENEITLLKNNQQLQENQLQLQEARIGNQRRQIYVAGIFLVITSLFILLLFRLNKKLDGAQKNLADLNGRLREANAAVVDINKNLEEKVDERTQQLRKAYEELDVFFYRSSHDFRRPLTTLMGLADVAKLSIADEGALDLFQKVRATAESLDKMLNKLQKMSELGFHELGLQESTLDVCIDNMLERFQQELNRKEISVVKSYQLLPQSKVYPALFAIVLENLIENAINFSRASDAYIKISMWETDASIKIEIADNGLGVPVEYQQKIFEMYFKAHHESRGNGLGLYLVKKAIEKMSGKISLVSEVKKGSTFTIEVSGTGLAPSETKPSPHLTNFIS